MSVINLYSLINCSSANGTWTWSGDLSSYPSPPSMYSGTIDLSTYPTGIYKYTYTTPQNRTVDVTIDWIAGGIDRIHNNYQGAITIPITTISNIQVTYSDNNLDYCDDGLNKPTLTSNTLFDIPSYFPNNISGDLWYKLEFPVCKEAYEVNVSVLRTDAARDIGIIVHTYYPDIGLQGSKIVKKSGFTVDAANSSVSIPVDSKARMIALLRIVTLDNSLGTYTININSSHTCTPSEVDLTVIVSGIANAYQEVFIADGTQTTFGPVTKNNGQLPTSIDSIMVMRNGQFMQNAYFSHDALAGTITLTFTPYNQEEITIIWFDTD